MTSAFEQAAAMSAQSAPQQTAPQSNLQTYLPPPQGAAGLADAYEGEASQLFSGNFLPPSLLNKTHVLGTERHGRITKAPYDTHSRDFNTKLPKYWAKSPLPDGRKIATTPTDHLTGEPLRPVLDTVIELATDYRFDAAEAAAVQRDANLPDDGARAFYVSGDDLKQLKNEIRRIGGITKDADLLGLMLSVTRAGQKPNVNGYPSWINKIALSR